MITTPANVIPFPTHTAKQREEIRYLTDWREQIHSAYATMTELGKCMADVLLDRIAADLASCGAALGGRAV